jgi:hypothetical protein
MTGAPQSGTQFDPRRPAFADRTVNYSRTNNLALAELTASDTFARCYNSLTSYRCVTRGKFTCRGGIAGLWENWKDSASGEWIRTFALITTDANELVADIHDRMPAILAPEDYARWLSDEPDPRGLMRPFPAGPLRMWPISTRVNKPEKDDPSIIEPIELASDAA